MRRREPLNGVRNRLLLLFFAITSAAVGFIYLYVVPQLSSSLTAERLERLERRGATQVEAIGKELRTGADDRQIEAALRATAARVDARVTLLGVRDGVPAFVIADSELESDAVDADYPAAQSAVAAGQIRSAVETVRGTPVGETAVPIVEEGAPVAVAVLSTSLADVEDNVSLIRRQILIAGAIALLAALIAGALAARAHSRRLRRLERAADEVARGNFRVPIPIDSTDEVGQLAMSLDQMQKRLARLDSARREFIANASHELRTPIASLGGFLELLEEEDPDPESRQEFVRTMRGQIDRLTKLTADLLDLSKLDSDALEVHLEAVDLSRVADEVRADFGPAADRSGHTIEARTVGPQKALAHADPARTAQILRILLDNALKHTPSGTRILIETQSDEHGCRLAVTDDGPGIEPAARERVFERFYTADSVSGSGLGLAIALELAHLMRGGMSLNTHRGRTTFALTLPSAAEPVHA